MGYTTVTDVRALSNLKTNEISDNEISLLINKVISEINYKINVKVIREKIEYIDNLRTNKIDGVNNVFYIKNWKERYIADMNNDGSVDKNDLIIYRIGPDNTETKITVSSIVHNEGKFILSATPNKNDKLYITYTYSSLDQNTPDTLLNLLTTYLTIAYAYLKIDSGNVSSIKLGSTSISKKISDSFGIYYDRYKMVLKEINSKSAGGGYFIDSKIKI